MIEFFSNGNGWLVLGLALIVIEMVANLAYVSISFGVGSILTGILIKAGALPSVIDQGIIDELLIAAIISTVSLLLLRKFFNKKSDPDINQY